MLIPCPECENPCARDATACPKCGHPNPGAPPSAAAGKKMMQTGWNCTCGCISLGLLIALLFAAYAAITAHH